MSQIIPIYIPQYISSVDYQPARVQPRILFYNGQVDCESFYVKNENASAQEVKNFPYFDNYNASGSQFPTTGSKSLLFFNEAAAYGEVPTESLYSEYWSKYVSLLYSPRTRLLNASAIIPLADYFKMELNDIVEFRGNYYHLRAINDYNLKNGECDIQLLGPILGDVLPNLLSRPEGCSYNGLVVDCSGTTTTSTTSTSTTTSTTSTSTTTSTTTTTTEATLFIEYLVVAGGGGGGRSCGGGGGAGGFVTGSANLSSTSTTYLIKVGNGGSGGGTSNPTNGQTSSFALPSASIAIGGGFGGSNITGASPATGSNGGSGGGTSYNNDGIPIGFAIGIPGQGNNGGVNAFGAGGGGGANGAGGGGTSTSGGSGGAGKLWLDGNYYAGGGGGSSCQAANSGLGGIGGGGRGGYSAGISNTTGSANTGGGGGGGSLSAAGGSGIVKIRYAGSGSQATGGIISFTGGYTYHTFTASGEFIY